MREAISATELLHPWTQVHNLQGLIEVRRLQTEFCRSEQKVLKCLSGLQPFRVAITRSAKDTKKGRAFSQLLVFGPNPVAHIKRTHNDLG